MALFPANANAPENISGTPVDLTLYNSSNLYEFTSNGYLYVGSNSALGSYGTASIYDKNGTNVGYVRSSTTVADTPVYNTVYVTKGMKAYGSKHATYGGNSKFIPMTS